MVERASTKIVSQVSDIRRQFARHDDVIPHSIPPLKFGKPKGLAFVSLCNRPASSLIFCCYIPMKPPRPSSPEAAQAAFEGLKEQVGQPDLRYALHPSHPDFGGS